MDLQAINLSFQIGIPPSCMQYSRQAMNFDWAARRFPEGWQGIPGFDQVIEACIPKETPLEAITSRLETVEIISAIDHCEHGEQRSQFSSLSVIEISGLVQERPSLRVLSPAQHPAE